MAKASLLFLLGLMSLSVFTNAVSLSHHTRAHARAAANTYKHYTGDFNGDGNTDFLRQKTGGWAGDGKDTVQLYLSSGRGTFEISSLDKSFDLNGELTNLYIGDFNGDGNDDILRQEKGDWSNDRVNTANLLLSDGKGGFQKIVLSEDFDLNGKLTNLYIGDFNGDGKDDVLRQEKGSWSTDRVNTANLLISTGNNFRKIALSEDFYLNGDKTNLYVGDFNGDGKDDVLRQEKGDWASDNVNMATLLTSTGENFRQTTLPDNLDLNGELTVLNIGDFNGDGYDDILRREKGSWATDRVNTAYLILSKGDGTFQRIVLPEDLSIPATYTNVYIGDFNGDGKDDVFRQEKGAWATGDTANTAQVLLSTGNGFRVVDYPYDTEMSGEISTLLVGDFNGDKTADFIQMWSLDTYYLHISQGDGTFF